jgi:aldehyde dehydrogenase (NAD+)
MTTPWHEERLLVDGELVDAAGDARFPTVNPATEEALGDAADAGVEDADRAVAAARRAFDETGWARDRDLRVRCLRQLHEALVDHMDDLSALITAEVGAPAMLCGPDGHQVGVAIENVPWFADLLEGYDFAEDLGLREVRGAPHRRWIEREPAGVVAAITPYNYPLQVNLAKLAPALAAGCTVVLKGAPDTPWSTLALGRLIAERTDFPAGVVNVLSSSRTEVGERLVTHPAVDMITFTGSTPVGRRIMAAASDTVKRLFLELGGKSAFVVLDDADLDQAVMFGAAMVCSHAGQGCAITTRLLVPEHLAAKCTDIAASVMGMIPYGDPRDPSMLMGPLINDRQRAKVERFVATAHDEGATLVCGGKRPEHLPRGYYFEPTLFTNVEAGSTLAQEEVFGPVQSIIAYEGGDEGAIALANNSMFGLSGAVFGGDRDRALAVARGIRAGTISLNGGMYAAPDAPFGGYKQSGIGREMGRAGFEEFLEVKTIAEPAT